VQQVWRIGNSHIIALLAIGVGSGAEIIHPPAALYLLRKDRSRLRPFRVPGASIPKSLANARVTPELK
jgi:hypothetical protein